METLHALGLRIHRENTSQMYSLHIIMDQEMIEKIFRAYQHLGRRRYLGCFCKDQMDRLDEKLCETRLHSLQPRHYGLINSGNYEDWGEHWIGLVVDFSTNSCGYFDSFGRSFKWLNDTLKTSLTQIQICLTINFYLYLWVTFDIFYHKHDGRSL